MLKVLKFYQVVDYSGREPFVSFHGLYDECKFYVKNSEKKSMLDIQFDYSEKVFEERES